MGWEQELGEADRMWRTYIEMAKHLNSHLQQHLQRECDLSAADFEVLVRLTESERREMPVAEVAAATQWEKSRLSHQLTRMAQRGLVERVDSDDRRYPDVRLTDKGDAAISKAVPEHTEMVHALFVDVLGPERLAGFAQACADVLRALDRHRERDCTL
ncbi:MarR family winged helix-turn-helix transcriptional regulator [Nonomuraea fuscirosea]|uniref:MarR family winged helix-turn-helix transcriptional regulator n=1 Tax=Nonomuraea fuscirosea TaxID=1291556 RepID=UPI0034231F35